MDDLIKMGYPVSADSASPPTGDQRYIAVTFDDGFISVLDNALHALLERNIPATIFIPTGYMGKKPGWISNPKHEPVMTEDQLRQLRHDLISVGSHTVTHPYLAKIDRGIAIRELIDSKKKLEDILHTEVKLLSLPYGSYNKDVTVMSKEAGYERVFLNIPTFLSARVGQYTVGRIHVSLDDWLIEYRLKLLGAYQWLPCAIAIKQKIVHIVKTFQGKT
jgi:peptidoglycan/xylan/chitin deacetylase (PgdA/CDA1 family)